MKNAVLSGAALWLTLSFASSPVQAAVYDFSFTDFNSPSEVYGSGTLTVSGGSSPFTVTAATGTIHDAYLSPTDYVINGLSPYAAADNLLYFPAVLAAGPDGPINGYVSFGGISFTTTTPGQEFNLGGGGTSIGVPYYDVLNDSTLNPNGYPVNTGQVGSYDISLTITAAPGPNVGEGLLGFAAMSVMLIAARYRGLIV
jgi:hypothetical protein